MDLHNLETAWFLAQLKPNCAQVANRNLRRQGFGTFMPMEEATRKRNKKFVTVLQPLFPGYIFVSLDRASEPWRKINSTYGVTQLVSFSNEPAPVPFDIISKLMLRCDASGKLMAPERLEPGAKVQITKGAFADFVAEIEHVTPGRRVWVLMDVMGRQNRVSLKPDQIRAL